MGCKTRYLLEAPTRARFRHSSRPRRKFASDALTDIERDPICGPFALIKSDPDAIAPRISLVSVRKASESLNSATSHSKHKVFPFYFIVLLLIVHSMATKGTGEAIMIKPRVTVMKNHEPTLPNPRDRRTLSPASMNVLPPLPLSLTPPEMAAVSENIQSLWREGDPQTQPDIGPHA